MRDFVRLAGQFENRPIKNVEDKTRLLKLKFPPGTYILARLEFAPISLSLPVSNDCVFAKGSAYSVFVWITRNRRRRAKALLDFERHDDDELGFRKNDIVTVSCLSTVCKAEHG